MNELPRLRVRLLIPIWGYKYIDLFCSAGLPSLLAPGNIPVLARETECEVIFLTTAASVPAFEAHPAYRRLCGYCATSFIPIDDIVDLANYGVTLTLAFARGIQSLGTRQIGTYFIFLNADFILSSDALTMLLAYLRKGYGAVLAPSLRCNEEDVRPKLARIIDRDGQVLDLRSRPLVALVLQHLHPTAMASIVNRPLFHHAAANQFLWEADERTLVGRFFLLFMLCIRADRRLEQVSGFCDYTFVPDLCPSRNWAVVKDSDELFMAEMQATKGESAYIRMGGLSPEEYAPGLSLWSTQEHRVYADETLLFHAADLPPTLQEVRRTADDFMRQLRTALNPKPAPHHNHPYWMAALTGLRARSGGLPRDLAGFVPHSTRKDIAQQLASRLLTLGSSIGTTPSTMPLHPRWLEYRLFRSLCGRISNLSSHRGLYVRERNAPAYPLIESHLSIGEKIMLDDAIDGGSRSEVQRFDFCLVHISSGALPQLGRLLETLAEHASANAALYLFVDGSERARSGTSVTTEFAFAVSYGRVMGVHRLDTTGGWTRANVASNLNYRVREFGQASARRRVLLAPRIIWLLLKVSASNLLGACTSRRAGEFCTSIALECAPDWAALRKWAVETQPTSELARPEEISEPRVN